VFGQASGGLPRQRLQAQSRACSGGAEGPSGRLPVDEKTGITARSRKHLDASDGKSVGVEADHHIIGALGDPA
jgi:hypothetical protein